MSQESTNVTPPLSGWEASAPPQDTALRQFILSQSALQRLSGEVLGATVVETEAFIAVDTGKPASMINFTFVKQPLHGAGLETAMDALRVLYEKPGDTGFVALFSPLPTVDLSPWGWTLSGHPPVQLRPGSTPPIDIGKVVVKQVASDADQACIEQIMIDGFGFEEMRGLPAASLLAPALFDDPRVTAWIGYVDGEPISGAASLVEAGIVNVFMVATVVSGRRKGGGLAVTQAAARPELGLPGVLFSSDEGRPVYERLGFVPILRGSFWYRNR